MAVWNVIIKYPPAEHNVQKDQKPVNTWNSIRRFPMLDYKWLQLRPASQTLQVFFPYGKGGNHHLHDVQLGPLVIVPLLVLQG